MVKALESVKEFAFIAFILLGVLFGMMIMNFIFGVLGPGSAGLTVGDVGYNQSIEIQNNSLQAIVVYSEGASTQFSTITIAIVLALLIAVFLLFWKIFVSDKGGKGESITGGTFG